MTASKFPWVHADKTVARQLRAVDELMLKLIGPGELGRPAIKLINSGGKRLRPALTLSAAALGKPKQEALIQAAAAIELTHLASMVHDDLLDKSPRRRQGLSAPAAIGRGPALLLGDYLLAKAFLASAAAGPKIAGLLAAAVANMAEGEAEHLNKGDYPPLSQTYLRDVQLKTAALFGAASCAGAVCAGLPANQVTKLRRFGEAFGTAFQIIDDLQDGDIEPRQAADALLLVKRYNRQAQDSLSGIKAKPAERLAALPEAYLDWASPL